MSVMDLFVKISKFKYKSYKDNIRGIIKNLLLNKTVNKENHKT